MSFAPAVIAKLMNDEGKSKITISRTELEEIAKSNRIIVTSNEDGSIDIEVKENK